MYKVQRIKLKGFRGYPDPDREKPFEFQFPESLNLIYGPNRAGKSSLLSSLEWVLFGSREIKKISDQEIPRQRKNWTVPHRESDETEVTITLKSEGETVEIQRKDDETPTIDGTADSNLAKHFGVTKPNYFATVHLHQQTIQSLLTATPKQRKSIFYNLLGLTEFEQAIEVLKDWRKYKYSSRMQEKLDGEIEKLEGRYEELDNQVDEILDKADFEEEDCSEAEIVERCSEIKEDLDGFCRKADMEKPELGNFSETEDRKSFFSEVDEIIDRLRTENPAQKRLHSVNEFEAEISSLSTKIESHEGKIEKLEESISEIAQREDQEGDRLYCENDTYDLNDVPSLIKTAQKGARQAREKKLDIWKKESKQAELIVKAEDYIGQINDLKTCPVCGNPTSLEQVSEHLKEHEKSLSKEAKNAKKQAEKLKEFIEESKKDKNQVEDDLAKLKKARSEKRDQLQTKLKNLLGKIKEEFPAKEFDLPTLTSDSVLSKVLDRIEKQLDDFQEEVKNEADEKQETLSSYQSKLSEAKQMQNVLSKKDKIQKLRDYQDSNWYKKADSVISRQANTEYKMSVLSEAISTTRRNLISERLEGAQDVINEFFKEISNRGYFGEIDIDEDLNLYCSQDKEQIDLRAIHNQGDLNAAALSLFLGMSMGEQISHDFGFLILDDPAQSLDGNHKKGFARLLERIAEDKQVILATHDQRVYQEMKDLTLPVNLIELSDWSAESGPEINTRVMK